MPLTEGRSSGGMREKPSRLYGAKTCSSSSMSAGSPSTVASSDASSPAPCDRQAWGSARLLHYPERARARRCGGARSIRARAGAVAGAKVYAVKMEPGAEASSVCLRLATARREQRDEQQVGGVDDGRPAHVVQHRLAQHGWRAIRWAKPPLEVPQPHCAASAAHSHPSHHHRRQVHEVDGLCVVHVLSHQVRHTAHGTHLDGGCRDVVLTYESLVAVQPAGASEWRQWY